MAGSLHVSAYRQSTGVSSNFAREIIRQCSIGWVVAHSPCRSCSQRNFLPDQTIHRRNLDKTETLLQPMSLCDAHANQTPQQGIDIFPEGLIRPERLRIARKNRLHQ